MDKSRLSMFGAALCVVAILIVSSPQSAAAEVDPLKRPAQHAERATDAVMLGIARAEKRFIAVGERGYVLLSDDNGKSWRQAKHVPASLTLTAVSFATESLGWAVGHGGLVLHSEDGGETWRKQLDGVDAAKIELEAAQKRESDNLDDEVDKRVRLAERLVTDGADKPFLDVHFFDSRRGIVLGTYGLIFATKDGGKNWSSLMGQIENPGRRHLYAFSDGGQVQYIVGEQGSLYRVDFTSLSFKKLESPYGGTYFGAVSGSSDHVVVFGMRGNAFCSSDRGDNWERVAISHEDALTAGTRLPNGTLILADQDGRIYRSEGGKCDFSDEERPDTFHFTDIALVTEDILLLTGTKSVLRLQLGQLSTSSDP